LAAAAHLEIERRTRAPPGIADRGDGVASLDTLAGTDIKALCMGVQRHDVVAMVDDEQVAEAAHPVREHHAPRVYGRDSRAFRGSNDQAVTIDPLAIAVGGHDAALYRPRQCALSVGDGRRGWRLLEPLELLADLL